MTGSTVVALRGLSKTYHPSPPLLRVLVRSSIREDVVALDGVDLDVAEGEICAVVGPNGAGKTTMFRILTGLTTPSSGSARVLGLDAHRQSLEVRRVIGWMPAEDRSLFMRLSCTENLHFHGQLQGMSRRELARRIPETLEQVGLSHASSRSIFALSAGMRARIQLARALLHRPRLIILDEPTGAVDPVGAHQLLGLISDLVREHRLAVLISSHRLEEIEALHSHAILLDQGRVRYQGDLDALRREYEQPQVELVFTTAGRAATAAAALDAGGHDVTCDGPRLVCATLPGTTTGELLAVLAPLAADIVHLRELAMPLRDLLARLYLQQPEPVTQR